MALHTLGLDSDARALALEAAIAAGADIVMGHGPHVIRPAEWVSAGGRGGLVFHSLGNLLGVMRRPDAEVNAPRPGVRDAPIVLVRMARDGRRVRATGYRVVPHFVDHDVRRGGHVSLRPLVGLAGERGCDRRCRSMARRLHAMDGVLAPRWGDAP